MPYDNEVMRLSERGTVVQWSRADDAEYDTGESLEEWGIHNLTQEEGYRVDVSYEDIKRARAAFIKATP